MKNVKNILEPKCMGNKTFNERNIIYDHVSTILDYLHMGCGILVKKFLHVVLKVSPVIANNWQSF